MLRSSTLRPIALGVLAALLPTAARAQVPQPVVPDINERSGLITRFEPPPALLPPDPRRDYFFGTFWNDKKTITLANSIHGSGLYGKRYQARNTASYYPFFYGSPGQNTLTPESRPVRPIVRTLDNFAHPWRPVGYYYAAGSYVPVHDLDPTCVGPGPFPWRFFLRRPVGG